MKTRILLAAAVLCALAPATGFAQTTRTATATITIPTVLFLDVTGTAINFANPTDAEFTAGVITTGTTSALTHRGNVVHNVTVHASTAAMLVSGTPSAKSASDLEWSLNGGTWAGLSTTAATVVSAAAAGAHSGASTVSYRMNLNLANDVPATYTLGFVYSVVAN
jgi:hypothetical protein